MSLLEELNKKIKNKVMVEKTTITIEATYMLDGSKYKRTVVVESPEAEQLVLTDFQKRFKDLIEIRSNGALIKFNDDGIPYIDWGDDDKNKKPE